MVDTPNTPSKVIVVLEARVFARKLEADAPLASTDMRDFQLTEVRVKLPPVTSASELKQAFVDIRSAAMDEARIPFTEAKQVLRDASELLSYGASAGFREVRDDYYLRDVPGDTYNIVSGITYSNIGTGEYPKSTDKNLPVVTGPAISASVGDEYEIYRGGTADATIVVEPDQRRILKHLYSGVVQVLDTDDAGGGATGDTSPPGGGGGGGSDGVPPEEQLAYVLAEVPAEIAEMLAIPDGVGALYTQESLPENAKVFHTSDNLTDYIGCEIWDVNDDVKIESTTLAYARTGGV